MEEKGWDDHQKQIEDIMIVRVPPSHTILPDLTSGENKEETKSMVEDENQVQEEIEKTDVEWEKLPSEIWEEVGKRLDSRLEVDRFRSACKSWRSILPVPSRFPLHAPPPPGARPFEKENVPFFITHNTVYFLGKDAQSSELVAFEEFDQDGRFELSTICYPKLPQPPQEQRDYRKEEQMRQKRLNELQAQSRTLLNKVFNGDDCNVTLSCVAHSYHLRKACPLFHGKTRERMDGLWNLIDLNCIEKIVLVSKDSSISPCYASEDGLAVVALLDNGQLALLRPDLVPLCWRIIKMPPPVDDNYIMDDILTYKGKLCAVDSEGSAFVLSNDDVFSPLSSAQLQMSSQIASGNNMITSIIGDNKLLEKDKRRNRLVESLSSELFLLVPWKRANDMLPKIKIFKLSCGAWFEVESLGDQAFFVGPDYSFSLNTNEDHAAKFGIPLANRILYDNLAFLKHHSVTLRYNPAQDGSDDIEDKEDCREPLRYCFLSIFTPPFTKLRPPSTSTSRVVAHYESSRWIHFPSSRHYL